MSLQILDQVGRWMIDPGPVGDVVFSSRIRLARNLTSLRFPPWATEEEKGTVSSVIREAVDRCHSFADSEWLDLDALDDLSRRMLVERHLISVEQGEEKGQKGVVIDRSQCVSMMVNEEDHIRLQTLQSGLKLLDAWRIASKVDDELASVLSYAFSKNWGYLTACPSNVGTGLRASVLMHLAGLTHSKQLGQVLNASQKLGLAIRGFYGEGSQAMGNLVQLSNQATLGLSETDILENLETRVKQIVTHERDARKRLLEQNKMEMEDKIWRAWGVLAHARMVSSQEAMELLSDVMLGVEFSVLPAIPRQTLSELLMMIQPAHLQYRTGKELRPEERDVARAELIRTRLNASGS